MITITTTLLTVFVAGCILVLMYLKFPRKSKRFLELSSRLPGPPPIPILGNLLMFAADPTKVLSIIMDLIIKYDFGPAAIWIANDMIVGVAEPDDIELLLANNNAFQKSWHYSLLAGLTGEGLFTNNNPHSYKINRKIIAPSFHFNVLKGFVPIFFEEASILVNSIMPDEETDLECKVGLCSLDITFRTSMGVKLNGQVGGGIDIINGLHTLFQTAFTRVFQPWLIFDVIFKRSSLFKKNEEARRILLGFIDNIITEKKKKVQLKRENPDLYDEDEPGVFLNLLLGDIGSNSVMSDQQIRDETLTLLVANETTSTALAFTLLMLALHQDVQSQVLEEIDNVFHGDTSRTPSLEDIQKLQLLDRTIKETLRLFPSAPIQVRNVQDDIDLRHYTVPKGCSVCVFTIALQRNPKYYENPNDFNPDNFLPEKCRQRPPYAYLPFSTGTRNCIGQKYGILMMKVILSTLLRHYTISPAGDIKRMEDIKLMMAVNLKSEKSVKVMFSKR